MAKRNDKLLKDALRRAKGEADVGHLNESAKVADVFGVTNGANSNSNPQTKQNYWQKWCTRFNNKRAEQLGESAWARYQTEIHGVGQFISLSRLNESTKVGVSGRGDAAVYERACLIITQAVFCDMLQITWDDALKFAREGTPAQLKDSDGKSWMDHVHQCLTDARYSQVDQLLNQKMVRYFEQPSGMKRLLASGTNVEGVRMNVLNALRESGLPEEILTREKAAAFGKCSSGGFPAKWDSLKGYFHKTPSFLGSLEAFQLSRDWLLRQIGELEMWEPKSALGSLYAKTSGETQCGGRFHTKTSKIGVDGAKRVLRDTSSFFDYVSTLGDCVPSELGNRYVPNKIVVDEDGAIIERKSKDRNTFAFYKGVQGAELCLVYPLQDAMSQLTDFVGLLGHGPTFDGDDPMCEAADQLKEFMFTRNSWGASWDFSQHDSNWDLAAKMFFGVDEFEGEGVLPRIFPSVSAATFKKFFNSVTKSPVWLANGLLFPKHGESHGLPSGSGFTNAGESIMGSIATRAIHLEWLIEEVPGLVAHLDEEVVDGIMEHLMVRVMGDDTASICKHGILQDYVRNISEEFSDIELTAPSIEWIASRFRGYGWVPSTDPRKISFFSQTDDVRMFDFTAHLSYVQFVDGTPKVWIPGYYPVLRALSSLYHPENDSPQEALIRAANTPDGEKLKISDLSNQDVLVFFGLLTFSILSATWMNPHQYTLPAFKEVIKYLPYGGCLFPLMANQDRIEKYLKVLRFREDVRGRTLNESSTIKTMINATAELVAEDYPFHEHFQELLDYLRDDDIQEPFSSYADKLDWSWDQIYDHCAAKVDPKSTVHAAKQLLEEYEMGFLEDLASSGLHLSEQDILKCMNAYAQRNA